MKGISYKVKNFLGNRTFIAPKKSKKKLTLKEMQDLALRTFAPKQTPEYIRAFGEPQENLNIDPKDYVLNARSAYGHIIETPLKTVDAASQTQPGLTQLSEIRSEFKPTEKLTGISQDRPEVILLADYLPLYTDDVEPTLTEAGKLLTAHIDERKIKESDVITTLNSSLSAVEKNALAAVSISTTLTDLSIFLRNLVTNTQATREMLDLRDVRLALGVNQLTTRTDLKQNYNLQDFLSDVGYKNSDKFSSTKLWIQSALDYKLLLKSHGLNILDNVSTQQRDDTNPVTLNFTERQTVTFNTSLKRVPTLKFLDTYSFDRIVDDSIVKVTKDAFDNLYSSNMPAELSTRLAAIIWMISQEYRYSNGLTKSTVIRNLTSRFDYSINTPTESGGLSNVQLFDAVFGTATSSAHKIPEVLEKAVTYLAYTKPGRNVGVLNFETSYLQTSDVGLLTPGAEYFIDSVLETFGTDLNSTLSFKDLKEFSNRLQNSSEALTELAAVMNFRALPLTDTYLDIPGNTAPKDYYAYPEALYTSPVMQLNQFKKEFLSSNLNSLNSDYVKTWLTAIIKLASSPNYSRLKTLLFLYVMSKTTRDRWYEEGVTEGLSDVITTTSNSVVQDRLLLELLKEINTITAKKSYARFVGTTQEVRQVTQEEGRNNLSSPESNKLLQKIVNMMGTYLSSIAENNEVTINERTRYRGLTNTFLAMAYFDAMLIFISSYAEITFGPRATNGNFLIVKTQTLYKDLLKNTKTILESEVKTLSEAYTAIVGTLQTVASMIKKYLEFLENNNTTNYLQVIKKSYADAGGDPRAMRLMFYEQQSMMISSNISDVLSVIKKSSNNDYIQLYDYNVRVADFKDYCLKAFSFNELKLDKGNAKILSVGIPIGFAENLKQYRQLTTNSWRRPLSVVGQVLKQNDIVTINVYKIDVRYPDVIFKPKKFKFELSRFPVRDRSFYLSNISKVKNFDDFINYIPMRDILQGNIGNIDAVQYGNKTLAKAAASSFSGPNVSITPAFETVDYDFLSLSDKRELIKNHAVSFLLELYVKFLTDLDVAENALYLDVSHVKATVEENIKLDAIQRTMAYVANVKPTTDIKDKNAVNNSQKLTGTNFTNSQLQDVMINALNNVSDALRLHTNLTKEKDVIKTLFAPRQFDRVYNLLVDPDEFEVDYVATTKTTFGKEVLNDLQNSGHFEFRQALDVPERGPVMFGVNKDAGDFSLDKYFVVIETMTDEYEETTRFPEIQSTNRRPRGIVI